MNKYQEEGWIKVNIFSISRLFVYDQSILQKSIIDHKILADSQH